MRRLVAAMIVFFSTTLYSSPREYFLFFGHCNLPFDPLKEQEKIDSSYFTCVRGNAFVDGFYIPAKTVGVSGRVEAKASTHYGTNHALFLDYYHEHIGSNHYGEVRATREDVLDTAAYQFGNPSRNEFRFIVGKQKPAFGINRYPETIGLNQMFDPRYMWGSPELGLNLIYDTQKRAQFEFNWISGDSTHLFKGDARNHFFASRIMYDFSLNGSTRSIFSIMVKKSGEKRLGFGIVSIGPNQNSFQAEWIRHYTSLSDSLGSVVRSTVNGSTEGLNSSSYLQLIRLSYQDSPARTVRTSFLFDDLSFHYRLYAFGLAFNLPLKGSLARLLIAFRQDATGLKKNRWILGTGVGFQL